MKRYFSLCSILLIAIFAFSHNSLAHAQQPTLGKQIPSDLALDLKLAQQNPAPEQKQILNAETKQTVLTSTTGDKTIVTTRDILTPEVETISEVEVLHPEQTTSEQVITKPVEVEVNDQGTTVPTNPETQPSNITPTETTGSLVPGTDILEPDDNAAPADNSTNPNLPAPTSSTPNIQSSITPAEQQPATQSETQITNTPSSPDNSQQNIPLESQPQNSNPINNQPPPQEQPGSSNNSAPAQPDNNPPASGNQSQPSDSGSSGGSDQSGSSTPDTSVQGTATGPNLIIFFIKQTFWHFFKII